MSAIEFRDLASGKPWTEEKQQRREPPKTCPGVRSEKRPGLKPLKPCVEGMTAVAAMMSPKLRTILRQASSSLERGHSPQLTPEGLGGTYVLTDPEARPIAVFKPCDEEPSAPNNPKRRAENLGHHVRAGEAALRECAAFLLDHERFAGVPETTFAKSACAAYFDASESGGASGAATPRQLKEKVGSLQEFVDSDCSAEEVGPALFSVGNVHRIAIFDIRVCNTDRHAGNLLVRWTRTASGDRSAELIPIDHGFCLPERLEEPTFDWYCWPQAKQPLSAAELAYIAALDADRDAELLRQALPIRPECFRTLKICTLFLQKAAKAGLTLFDMAGLMLLTGAASPRDAPAESALQQLVHEAEAQAAVKVARVSSLVSAERQQLMRTKYFFRLFEAALDHFLADWARERHGDHGRLSDSSGCSPVSAASADTASSADLGHGPADCDFPGDRFRRRPVPGRDFSLVLVDSSPLAEKVPPALLAAADTP